MAKEDVVNKISKGAELAKQNSKNEAKRLEEKVKAYNASTKNNDGINSSNSLSNTNQSPNNKSTQSNSNMKQKLVKKGGSAALQSMGVPKGVSDKAMDFAQSEKGQKMIKKMNKRQFGAVGGALMNKAMDLAQGKETEQSGDSGEASATGSIEFIKKGLMICAAVFPVFMFACLVMICSHVFLNAISLGTADSLSGEDVETKINKKGTKGLNEEKTDENIAYDIYISDNKSEILKNSKLNNNIIQVANETTYLKRKYNEASLDKIEDFYPGIDDISKNYDKNMAYDFFFKMYNLYITYRDKYNVNLDLPLLMSVLNLQSIDKNVVFSSNLDKRYRTDDVNDIPKDELDYYHDWSSYKISRNNSEHDMEILAQHMVSVTEQNTENSCEKPVDNKCYTVDHDKYKEFLKEFLEKKYYIEGESTIEGSNSNNTAASGSFRKWTQCGQSWSSTIVPTSSRTMCEIGCLVTSITMQIARSGTAITTDSIDPGIAVKKFDFVSGGNLKWYSVSNLAPNFKYHTKINLIGMTRSSVASKLTSYDSSKYYIVLNVGKKERGYAHHYVALDYVDLSNNEIYIMDPASTSYTKLYDVYKVYNAHIYQKKD